MKSHSVARFLLIRARQEKTRVACFREFQNSIAESSHQLLSDLIKHYDLKDFVVTDKGIVNKITGSDFLFKGLWHNEQSIKSIEGIDIAWVEEAQTVSTTSLEVLTPTVRKDGSQIVYTYNRLLDDDPVHKRLVLEGRPNTLIINVNYDIAIKYSMMPDTVLKEIEDDKLRRPALYKTKWLGEPNSNELKIYQRWHVIDELPPEARLVRRGLDYGYTNDPSAAVDIYKYNGGYILDEVLYRKGLSNKTIADILLSNEDILTVGDSSEPKSNDELKLYGINIIPATKGPGSVNQGIQLLQDSDISVTKRSKNIITEKDGYLWLVDREGKILNTPQDFNNHALDAARYAISSMHLHEKEDDYDEYIPEEPRYAAIGI